MTHSRWIREKDPLNIYRYSERIYGMFHFKGQPNRVRPHQYRRAFESNGWTNVSITPAQRIDSVPRGLNRRFSDPEMTYLSIVVQAVLRQ